MAHERRRAHAHRHADPAHARDVAHRHPRPLAREHAARGSPADPHLRGRATTSARCRRRSGASCCARVRCSTCTTACRTSSTSPTTCASSCPRRASRSRTVRWTRAGSSGSCRSSGSTSTTCSCARRSSRAASTCRPSTRSSSTAPTCSGSRSCTSCAVASAGAVSARTRTCSIRRDRALSEEAYERLKTIGEFTDLGSGFKIAMRDLEIRGAGNLLGAEQSGHIAAVGFDLYVEMVTEAVGELTGEVPEHPAEVQIDLPVTAHLPRDYIARDDVRMEAYRRLAAVTTPADVDDVRAEWEDRYGPPPPPARGVARRRAPARRVPAARHPGGVGAEGPGPARRLAPAQVAGGAAAAHGRRGARCSPTRWSCPSPATRRGLDRPGVCSGCSTRSSSPAPPPDDVPCPRRPRYHPPDDRSPSLAGSRPRSSSA